MADPVVIFEDESILVLDKPTGWVVNDAATAHGNPIVQNWLRERFDYELSQNSEMRSGIVHRLDKETSGILIVGKTSGAFTELQRKFKEREISKSYVALVHGKVKSASGVISEPVGRLPWNRERFGVLPGGKPAETGYELSGSFKDEAGNFYSLLKLFPKTGRTHQIRIHLKHIGHSIVSDTFYAGRKTSRNDRKWCPRLFLYAQSIALKHPVNGKSINFSVSIPDDLSQALQNLEKIDPLLIRP